MKRILFLISLVFIVSCEKEKVEPAKCDTTLMAYFVADNNLSNDLQKNIVSLYTGMQNLKERSTLLVFYDGNSSSSIFPNPSIIEYVADGKGLVNGLSGVQTSSDILKAGKIVKQYSSPMFSTDKDNMSRVISDMINLSNSEYYGLIFGSHASGWLNSIYGGSTRSFGQDGSGTDNTILIPDMKEALKHTGHRFKYILFDACMMGNVETLYEFKDVCDYTISSPSEVPGRGFPYSDVAQLLFSDNTNDYTINLCKAVRDYFDKSGLWGTYIAVKSNELDNFVYEYSTLLKSNNNNISKINIDDVQLYTEGSTHKFHSMSYDVKDYFNKLTDNKIPISFINQLNKTVVSCYFVVDPQTTGAPALKDITLLCGLGMYDPCHTSYTSWNNYYKTLDWANDSGWNGILAGM